ncbi:MAG: DUF2330 domain-containing protein [Planctomycetota bacterium]
MFGKDHIRFGIVIVLGGILSGGVFADGMLVPPEQDLDADLFEPQQKAIIVHDGNQEDMILQIRYEGSVKAFAWVVPTPTYPEVKLASGDPFPALLKSLHKREVARFKRSNAIIPGGGGFGGGVDPKKPPVSVHERKKLGPYDISILSTSAEGEKGIQALVGWLDKNGYKLPAGADQVLAYYVERKAFFTAMRIDVGKTNGEVEKRLNQGTIQPVVFSFASEDVFYPLRVSSLNRNVTEVLLYVFHRDEEKIGEKLWKELRRREKKDQAAWKKRRLSVPAIQSIPPGKLLQHRLQHPLFTTEPNGEHFTASQARKELRNLVTCIPALGKHDYLFSKLRGFLVPELMTKDLVIPRQKAEVTALASEYSLQWQAVHLAEGCRNPSREIQFFCLDSLGALCRKKGFEFQWIRGELEHVLPAVAEVFRYQKERKVKGVLSFLGKIVEEDAVPESLREGFRTLLVNFLQNPGTETNSGLRILARLDREAFVRSFVDFLEKSDNPIVLRGAIHNVLHTDILMNKKVLKAPFSGEECTILKKGLAAFLEREWDLKGVAKLRPLAWAQAYAISSLRLLKAKEAVPVIMPLLSKALKGYGRDGHQTILLQKTIEFIGEAGATEALPLLQSLMKKPAKFDALPVNAAVDALALLEGKKSIPLLAKFVKTHMDWHGRYFDPPSIRAARKIVELGDRKQGLTLLESIAQKSEIDKLRKRALRALKDLRR